MPSVWRRHPAYRIHHRPGADSKSLAHLGEPLDPPHVSPARGPPVDWGELVQSQGAGEFEQPTPDDLPTIDIHHCGEPVPPFATLAPVAALKAIRKRSAPMAEFAAWSCSFSPFSAGNEHFPARLRTRPQSSEITPVARRFPENWRWSQLWGTF